jgi:hypothetical protein
MENPAQFCGKNNTEGHQQQIEPIDPPQAMPHQLHWRQGSRSDQMPEFYSGVFVKVRHEFQLTAISMNC